MSNYLENKTILLISPEAWGPIKVSKHHYATYLSKKNKVYFLNPSLPAKKSLSKFKIQVEKINDGLSILSYRNILPKLNQFPKTIQKLIYAFQAKKIQAWIPEPIDIVWTFDPYRYWDQGCWKVGKHIYHSVDVHFSKGYENIMAQTSNLVFINSEILRANLEKFNQRVFKINHGTDIDQLTKAIEFKPNLPGKNKLKAGLVANFNHNIDFDLIGKMAEENPTIDFIMIGPYRTNNLGITDQTIFKEIETLKKLSNVFFIGGIDSDQIKNYLDVLDINLVLYKESKTWSKNNTSRDGIIINPHKIMAYLFSGKLLVSSFIHEYCENYQEVIIMSKANSELPELIKKAASQIDYYNGPELIQKRIGVAIANSYDNQIKKIGTIIQNEG